MSVHPAPAAAHRHAVDDDLNAFLQPGQPLLKFRVGNLFVNGDEFIAA